MQTDPLARPVEGWSRADLDELVGREETIRLELKGAKLDISSRSGRRKIAREVAGMQSAAGGYIVIGTEPGSDVVTTFPGLAVGEAQIEQLRRSLLDLVQPFSLIRGPVAIPADSPSRKVLVIEVLPHPAGVPAFADDRFWIRTGDESRPMDPDETRRRFETAALELDPLRERALLAIETASTPVTRAIEQAVTERGREAMIYSPIAVAVVPRHTMTDFDRSGRDMLALLASEGRDEFEKASRHGLAPGGPALHDNAITTAFGVTVPHAPFSFLTYSHDAVLAASSLGILEPWAGHTGQVLDPQFVERVVVRAIALGLRMIAKVAGPSEALVVATSGTIPGSMSRSHAGEPLPADAARDPGAIASIEFVTASHGSAAVAAVASAARILAQRIHDARAFDSIHEQQPNVVAYLDSILSA